MDDEKKFNKVDLFVWFFRVLETLFRLKRGKKTTHKKNKKKNKS